MDDFDWYTTHKYEPYKAPQPSQPPPRQPLIHEEVESFKAWFDAWWLGDKEHGQVVPTQGHELFPNYMSEYTLAFGAWMAAKQAAHGIKDNK